MTEPSDPRSDAESEPRPDSDLAAPITDQSEWEPHPGPDHEPAGLVAETSEGIQEMSLRATTTPGALRREVGLCCGCPKEP